MESKIIRHTTKIRVRYADTDKMGFVYNGMYFTYFETGRAELMRYYGLPYTEFEKAGYYLPLTDTYARYHSPAYYDDLLEVEASLKLEMSPIVQFDYIITKYSEKTASGYTRHIFMNAETMKPVKPPKIFRDALASFRDIA